MALEFIGGTLFTLLYDGVKQAMSKSGTFKSLLGDLKSTLDSLVARDIQQIGEHNVELGLPNEEIEGLKMLMEEGVKLVEKLSNFRMWNYCCLNDYSEQIVELDRALKRLLQKLKMQEARDVKEVLVLSRQNRDKLDEVNRRLLDIQKLLQERAGDVMDNSVSGGNGETGPEQIQGNGVEQGTDLQRSKGGQVTSATLGSAIRGEKIDPCKLLDESPQRAALFSPASSTLLPSVQRSYRPRNLMLVGHLRRDASEIKSTKLTSFDGGTSLQAVFVVLFDVVIEVKDKTTVFKPLLGDLKSTLDSLKPLIEEIAKHNKVLDRPKEELENFRIQMEKGVELIRKCSKVRLWSSCKRYKYTDKLMGLDGSLQRLLNILKVQVARDAKETLISVKNIETVIKKIEGSGLVQDQIQTKGWGVLSEPLSPRAGLDIVNVEGTRDAKEELVSVRHTKAIVEQIEDSSVVQNQRTSGNHSSSRNVFSNTSSSAGRSQFSEASSPRMEEPQQTNGQILDSPNLRVFTFAEMKAATRNFKSDVVLGEGGFGKVFKGWVDEKTLAPSKVGTGMMVAIKKLNPESVQGFHGWQSELNFLGRLSHPNLVKLLGYCRDDKVLLLVYEFMQKGSLENHLFRRSEGIEPPSWDIRLKIAIGAARGLAFLHGSEKQIIYRDFNSSNILLDGNFNAKIADFGLAKLGPVGGESHVSTRIMGTYGFAAPEYIATGHLYVKSSVYGFGVVLLEILTGLRALDTKRPKEQQQLVEWAKPLLLHKRKLKDILDVRMEGQYAFKAALQTAQITQKCLAPDPKSRPSMKEVVEELEKIQAIKEKPKQSRLASEQPAFSFGSNK